MVYTWNVLAHMGMKFENNSERGERRDLEKENSSRKVYV